MEPLDLLEQQIDELLDEHETFAFETMLATKSYRNRILSAQQKKYSITLVFFWLQTIELAKERVRIRVAEGGHNIDNNVIERRYISGIRNLFNIYLPIVNEVLIFDNSNGKHELIAEKIEGSNIHIINSVTFALLKLCYDNNR